MLGRLEVFSEVVMNKRLDPYLQKLDHELRPLPEDRREEELREIRQHLEAIVTRLMEGGLSEEEAVEAATSQFGEAHAVGHELVKVVPMAESPVRLLAASVCAVTCYLSLNLLLLLLSIQPGLIADLIPSLKSTPALEMALPIIFVGYALVFFATPWIAATVFRCFAPKNLQARSGIACWIFSAATCLLIAALMLSQ